MNDDHLPVPVVLTPAVVGPDDVVILSVPAENWNAQTEAIRDAIDGSDLKGRVIVCSSDMAVTVVRNARAKAKEATT